MRCLAIAIAATVFLTTPATARERPVWTATRSADPITGKTSCIVAAYDRVGGSLFTRFGALYPIVELNSELGLLVGVSSGGTYRMPTGDIVWRVDDLPFREIRAADNPGTGYKAPDPNDTVTQVTQQSLALARSLSATSTVASSDRARAMLEEMRKGQGLQFRQAAAAGAYGLPQQRAMETGQITKKGLRPYPLDASFHSALQVCGIGQRSAPVQARP